MIIDARTQTVLLRVKDPLYLRQFLTKSRLVDHDYYNIAVKHTMEATKVLRNVGIKVPTPIRGQYGWPGKYKPFDHQMDMSEFLTMHRRCFNLSEMGVGKSASALWAADFLMTTKRVKKVLVVTPLSTLERVWKQDIFDVLMHRTCAVVHGPVEKRLAALRADVDFYLLNHDGVKIGAVADAIYKRPDIDLVIVDEASMFRNAQTSKYKAFRKMLRPDQRLWLLTGTPCPSAPTDAWALARLVDDQRVPKFFGAFKRLTMQQFSTFKWVPRPNAYRVAYDAMQPAIRFKKADCLDLPPVTITERQTTLTKEQIHHITSMKRDMTMQAQSGKTITAANAADQINKLRQILCGSVKNPKTGAYEIIPHAPRVITLLETIAEANAKALIVVPFKGIIRALQDEIKAHYTSAVLNGDVPIKRRDQIIVDFKTQADPHVLLCHPVVMSHGLNLTEADMLIFYAPIYGNDYYQQVLERFNRAGQKNKMTVVRIGAHPLEWSIYKMVDAQGATQNNILQLYSSFIEGM